MCKRWNNLKEIFVVVVPTAAETKDNHKVFANGLS